ncbi:MAG: DUF427 domain-containing protein [Aeromicrobium sp.]
MTTMQAVFNGTVIAESDQTIVVEGNHYFPSSSLRADFIEPSATHTVCGWKGTASYYDVHVDGAVAHDGVWYYPDPSPEATKVKDRVAFWKGVTVRVAAASEEPASFQTPDGAVC